MKISAHHGRISLQALTLLGISVAVSLGLAELFLHVFPGVLPLELQVVLQGSPDERGVADARIGDLPPPNSSGTIRTRDFEIHHRIDAHGFRNPEPWPQRADVVVIGDSLVFGYGVETGQAWPEVLEDELGNRSVVNLGLIGAGPQQYRRIYETFARDLEPRVVVIAMFVANDFWDADLFEQWLDAGGKGNYLEWRDFGRQVDGVSLGHPVASLRYLAQRHSYLYNLLRFARQAISLGNDTLQWSGNDGVPVYLTPSVLAKHTVNASASSPVFTVVVDSIRAMRDEARAQGAQTLVVFQPSKEEVYLPSLGKAAPDPGAPLRAALKEIGIPYLDLEPAFRQHADQGERLFFSHDGHPDAAGYKLIAEQVAAYIEDSKLLEKDEASRNVRDSSKMHMGVNLF